MSNLEAQTRILHVIDCCDGGEPYHSYTAQARFNGGEWFAVSSQHSDSLSDAMAGLSNFTLMLQTHGEFALHRGTVRHLQHTHIGDYGSPNRFRCDVLDAWR